MTHPPQQKTTAALDLNDIRNLILNDLPDIDAPKNPEDIMAFLAQAQGKEDVTFNHPRVALFLSRHGSFAEDQAGLDTLLSNLQTLDHAIADGVAAANADLQAYDLNIAQSAHEIKDNQPALTTDEATRAIAYGMMAVQAGIDLLCLSCPNPATEKIADLLDAELAKGTDPFEALILTGGTDIAGVCGAMIAARLGHVPILIEGRGAEVAKNILSRVKTGADHHIRHVTDIGVTPDPSQPMGCALPHSILHIQKYLKTA